MRVTFKVFRAMWSTWEQLFQEAADFAGRLDPTHLIAISHSQDGNDGVVTVWYWDIEDDEAASQDAPPVVP